MILCWRILDFFNFPVMFKQAKNHIRLRPRICRCFPNCDLDSSRDKLLRIGLFELNQSGDCTLYGLQAPPFVPLSIVDWTQVYQDTSVFLYRNMARLLHSAMYSCCKYARARGSSGSIDRLAVVAVFALLTRQLRVCIFLNSDTSLRMDTRF